MKRPIVINLKLKAILTALVLALTPLFILAALNLWSVRQSLTDVANQTLTIAAEQTANRIDQFLLENLMEIRAAGQLSPFAEYLKLSPKKRPGSMEEIRVTTILRTLSRKNLFLPTPCGVLDASGINILDTKSWRMGENESQTIYFQTPIQTGAPYISPILFPSKVSRQAFFYVSGPIFNVAGIVVGVLRMQVSIAFLEDFIASTSGLAGPDSFGLLLDKNHLILAHSKNQGMVFKTSRPLSEQLFEQLQSAGQLPQTLRGDLAMELPTLEKALQTDTGSTVFTAALTPGSSQSDQAVSVALGQANWRVVVAQPRDTFLKPIGKQINSTLWLVCVISLIVIAVAIMVAHQLTRPILNMTDIARQIATGDLTVQVPIPSHDELGLLAQSFNDMTAQLRDLIGSLQRSEEKYRRLTENAKDMIYRMTLPEGKYEYVNLASVDVFGYTPDEFYASPLLIKEIIHPDWRDYFNEQWANLLNGKAPLSYEYQIVHKSGSIKWLYQRNLLLLNKKGVPIALESIVTDITERKLAEQSLIESHERFLKILDSIDASIYVADMNNYEILFMNKHMKESFDKDLTGKICWDVFRGETGPCPRCTNDKLIDENGKPTDVVIWQDKNPITEKFYINHDRAIEWTDGRIVRLQIATDISELKKLEAQLQQAQKMESIGRLAGGVAHDYNNLSSIIIGYAELALEQVKPEDPLHENLEQILTAAMRSTDITRQLLAFARKQTIAPKVIDLNETIENMLNMFRRLIGENIDLDWLPGAKIWQVKLDPSQIDQIMANLCVNARDAIADVGKVIVETKNIRFNKDDCDNHADFVPGEYVSLAVSDNGSGIETDILENIFEPFFTTKDLGRGTGLGLSTVYGIVKQNNGFVNACSEPGKGTTIRIYLPRHASQVVETGNDDNIKNSLSRGEIILLVEDESSILKLVKRILEKLGYILLATSSPLEALNLAKNQSFKINLLITDVVMPEMNGRVLSEQIKSIYPDLKTLFMSGYTADVIAHQGILEDDVFFISKPFSIKEIAAKVREVLDPSQ
ncbi:two domain fusion protein (N:Methyl-accepting chemotaxis protein-C:sensory box histidine kinase/response regulator) [Desulforapulum autotrophicum HRM2]|uniref:histidine kinase n=1 Tax=Desulforapulum autotrophicum (strain ATCC 43914 / DSM 3382 / VKM B-1955 / HRM2) TaxID=177437 RepID=C0QBH0_DESAH|nr:ATP-binding protein [Desulforapulum autotrophicum]ACN16972.1 two domain fusion protein (N:Methyl-accepting chemotaxis protein-C:sensory box histidine kinase/response regulator) [Desulforapulum autotrophicum HRM2]